MWDNEERRKLGAVGRNELSRNLGGSEFRERGLRHNKIRTQEGDRILRKGMSQAKWGTIN